MHSCCLPRTQEIDREVWIGNNVHILTDLHVSFAGNGHTLDELCLLFHYVDKGKRDTGLCHSWKCHFAFHDRDQKGNELKPFQFICASVKSIVLWWLSSLVNQNCDVARNHQHWQKGDSTNSGKDGDRRRCLQAPLQGLSVATALVDAM